MDNSYYVMDVDESADSNVIMNPMNNVHARLQNGDLINTEERKLELPFRFDMEVRRNPDGSRQVPRPDAYDSSIELMHKDLVKALQENGVDNLQVFPSVVIDECSEDIIEDFVVVNVVGLVSCASAESDSMPFSDGIYFKNLVIDPTATHNLLMFRLAESKLDLLVHERVAKDIKKRNFPYLLLTPIDEV